MKFKIDFHAHSVGLADSEFPAHVIVPFVGNARLTMPLANIRSMKSQYMDGGLYSKVLTLPAITRNGVLVIFWLPNGPAPKDPP